MAVPLDAIRVIHNAFRKDMAAIDAASYKAARRAPAMEELFPETLNGAIVIVARKKPSSCSKYSGRITLKSFGWG